MHMTLALYTDSLSYSSNEPIFSFSLMITCIRHTCVVVVLCGSLEPDLQRHTEGLLIYFPSILGHAPDDRMGMLKA